MNVKRKIRIQTVLRSGVFGDKLLQGNPLTIENRVSRNGASPKIISSSSSAVYHLTLKWLQSRHIRIFNTIIATKTLQHFFACFYIIFCDTKISTYHQCSQTLFTFIGCQYTLLDWQFQLIPVNLHCTWWLSRCWLYFCSILLPSIQVPHESIHLFATCFFNVEFYCYMRSCSSLSIIHQHHYFSPTFH